MSLAHPISNIASKWEDIRQSGARAKADKYVIRDVCNANVPWLERPVKLADLERQGCDGGIGGRSEISQRRPALFPPMREESLRW